MTQSGNLNKILLLQKFEYHKAKRYLLQLEKVCVYALFKAMHFVNLVMTYLLCFEIHIN